MSKANNPTSTTPAQRRAMAKYQSNSVRWTATAKIGSKKEHLLSLAKQDKAFVGDFWDWLDTRYAQQLTDKQ